MLRLVDRDEAARDGRAAARPARRQFRPDTPVASLSLAQQQMVEIAKALSVDARLVILDEPTSSLPLAETEKLLDVIAGLKADGIAVIFISHRLHEIEQRRRPRRRAARRHPRRHARQGRDHARPHGQADDRPRPQGAARARRPHRPARSCCAARGVRTGTYPAQPVDLDLRRGEILGLAGLVGAGRTELARALFGIDPILGGHLVLDGEAASAPRTPPTRWRAASSSCPRTARAPACCSICRSPRTSRCRTSRPIRGDFMVSRGARNRRPPKRSSANLGIKAPNVTTRTGSLSGGNQQKVVLAKWLAMDPEGHHLRRADPRHRRRRQGGDLSPDARNWPMRASPC